MLTGCGSGRGHAAFTGKLTVNGVRTITVSCRSVSVCSSAHIAPVRGKAQSVNVSGKSGVRVEIDVIDLKTGAKVGSTTGKDISWLGPNTIQPSSDAWQVRVHIPGSSAGSGNFRIDVVGTTGH